MFGQLFQRSKALARQRTGPLAAERRAYLTNLAQQVMSRATLREAALYLLIVAHQLRLAQRPAQAIPFSEIHRQATRWANRPERKTTAPEGIRLEGGGRGPGRSWDRRSRPRKDRHPAADKRR